MSRSRLATAVTQRSAPRVQVTFGVAGAIGIFLAVAARALNWNGATVVVVGCALITVLGAVGIPLVLLPREQEARALKWARDRQGTIALDARDRDVVAFIGARQGWSDLYRARSREIGPQANAPEAPYDEKSEAVEFWNASTAVHWVAVSRINLRPTPFTEVMAVVDNAVEEPSGTKSRERRARERPVPLLDT
jgi:hypothetical protein